MGEHKYREASLKIKLLVFVGGVLIVTACIYRIGYLPPLGIIGAHATGKMLGVGAINRRPNLGSFSKEKTTALRSDQWHHVHSIFRNWRNIAIALTTGSER